MNDIYLIRHTTPAVAKGVCYGQTDLDITATFLEEAEVIRQVLPPGIGTVHSSPLQRCARLASHLFPEHTISLQAELMEVHCGEWEMKSWDELPKEEIDPWMADFVNIRIPGGESYLDLQARVNRCWDRIRTEGSPVVPVSPGSGRVAPADLTTESGPIAVVAHGGVIRTILSTITGTPLIDSFKVFGLNYGCVIRVFGEGDKFGYEILSNRTPAEKEQHKPSSFYKK
ncbi:MAG TPA: alpha-ribazole phosphatase family protein [Puia sp.]|jgi:alpha-ribazole phosphatase